MEVLFDEGTCREWEINESPAPLPELGARRRPSASNALRAAPEPALADIVCLSHLRWNFVFQRPQHLLTRFCRDRRVFYVEEPVLGSEKAHLEVTHPGPENLHVVTPHLPISLPSMWQDETIRRLMDGLFAGQSIRDYVLWYYTPMALGFTSHLKPRAIVYDCMDELASFKFAPPQLGERERELFNRADVVFTGGRSLHEAKQGRHPNMHCFPSSIDVAHFRKARTIHEDPLDQALLPQPRLGYFGVLDERIDLDLIREVAAERPDWQLVFVGPICKITPDCLPHLPNIHYLGQRPYKDLPYYVAGWDVALLPFALNDSTRYISPTKTPEYLAAGKPVVSTSVQDVVRPYGQRGFAFIADGSHRFIQAIDRALQLRRNNEAWLEKVDAYLSCQSWDRTWSQMNELISNVGRRMRHGSVV